MRKLLFISSLIVLLAGCKKDETNDYPLVGTYYLKAFGTSIYCMVATGIVVQGDKSFPVKLKPAEQPGTYYIVSAADESKAFQNSGGLIELGTITTPESSSQAFAFDKVSNVDAYYIVPQNATTKTLAVDLPTTLTYAVFLRDKSSTDPDLEGRFVLEP